MCAIFPILVTSDLLIFGDKFLVHIFSSAPFHESLSVCSFLIVLLIFSLINDVYPVIQINGVERKVDGRIMNCEKCGRKRQWLIFLYYADICLERLRKTTKCLSQNSLYLGRRLTPGFLEYEAGVLTTPPRHLAVQTSRPNSSFVPFICTFLNRRGKQLYTKQF